MNRRKASLTKSKFDDQAVVDTTAEEAADVDAAGRQEEEHDEPPSKHMGDLFLGVIFILVSIWGGWEAINMPRRGELGVLTSPGLTPILLCVALIILSLIMVVKALRGGAIAEIPGRLKQMTKSYQTRRVLILAAIITGYVLLIGVLDYGFVTFLFLLVAFLYVRAGRWYTILLAALAGTVLTTMLLPYFFSMPTP